MAIDAEALEPRAERCAVEGGSRYDFLDDDGARKLAEGEADLFVGGAFDDGGGEDGGDGKGFESFDASGDAFGFFDGRFRFGIAGC